ncbi:6721_t:CDS:1 [Ambispora leptoticha]|uniref:6721_t:CDS:1 n=1 Tax=Ambispora leptoticha TaxID=144679 RepID=A0A9N8WI36_9GLOM|nr:6721_t:CDS:1 [Ambispora leptoticha]
MRNIIPAPTIDEVLSMLNRSYRESPTGQRDRSASPDRRTPSRRDETTNRNNVNKTNNTGKNSSNNTNNVSENLSGNLNNATYSSSSELANMISKLNTSTSRSDSDLSIPDVRDS